jgi:hypothetical protein
MKIAPRFPASNAAEAPTPRRAGDFAGNHSHPAGAAHLAAAVCCALMLGGCGRQASTPPSSDDSALYDLQRSESSLVVPFEDPVFNTRAEPRPGDRLRMLSPFEESPSTGDQGAASPFRAAQLVGPLGSQTMAGPLVDRELAAIPVPNSFNDVKASPAREMLEQGNRSMREGKWDDAIAAFYQAVNVEPNNSHAYESLGQCYVNKDEPAKAIANLDSAIRFNSKAANAYIVRATANIKLKFIRRAVDDLNTAIELEPENVTALTWRAIAEINEGHSREARADCTTVLKLHSGVLDAYVVRCLANLQLADPNGARADYRAAAERGLNAESLKMMRGWFELFGQPLTLPATH